MPYIFRDQKLKEERLQKIEKTRIDLENSSIDYSSKIKMLQKVHAYKFLLGLKEGNDYLQLLATGGLGFILGFIANDGMKNNFNNLAKDFVANLPQYSKS